MKIMGPATSRSNFHFQQTFAVISSCFIDLTFTPIRIFTFAKVGILLDCLHFHFHPHQTFTFQKSLFYPALSPLLPNLFLKPSRERCHEQFALTSNCQILSLQIYIWTSRLSRRKNISSQPYSRAEINEEEKNVFQWNPHNIGRFLFLLRAFLCLLS